MRADGSNPHPITPARLEAGSPDWAPDGRRIVFNSNTPRTGSSVFTIKPDGSEVLFEIDAGGGDEELDTGFSESGILFPAWGTTPIQR